ncbi:hypothetical protein NPIL_630571 [Nephila pilipes]|uniref:Uncharacterized protein n=1 Tax=Nephila pilipes TaxID=299642 RepID=A0A8X6UHT5_NEPPI|nr:hypothetical protein NPIL_630571 [Nephila pilipes]
MCDFVFSYLNIANLISDMLRTRGLTIEKSMSRFESLSSDCRDTPVENSSDEEMSIDDSTVAASSGSQNAKNIDQNLEDLNVPNAQKGKIVAAIIPIFFH